MLWKVDRLNAKGEVESKTVFNTREFKVFMDRIGFDFDENFVPKSVAIYRAKKGLLAYIITPTKNGNIHDSFGLAQ